MASRHHRYYYPHRLIYFTKVRFNEDMMSLNYEPQHLKQAEAKLEQLFNAQEKTVLLSV